MSKQGESQGGWKIAKMNTTNLCSTQGEQGGMEPRTSNYSGTIDPSDGQWHHVAVVHGYQGTKQRLYYDGVLVDEQSRSGTIQASNGYALAFGARDDATNNGAISPAAYSKTHIDDARYYNRALEGYEIKAMTIRSNKLISHADTPQFPNSRNSGSDQLDHQQYACLKGFEPFEHWFDHRNSQLCG